MAGKKYRVSMPDANPHEATSGNWPIFILGMLWLGLVAWRPMVFGFYHDDWSSVALPLDRSGSLGELLLADPGRPLYLIVLYGLRFFLTDKVVLWQVLLAIVHLLNALAIYRMVVCIFMEESGRDRQLAGALAGTLWLAYPWSLGYSAWAIMLPPDIGLLMAILGVTQVMRPGADTKAIAVALSLLSLSWLIYESTWLIWLPFSLLLLARAVLYRESKLLAWRFFWMSCLLQGLFIIVNRVISAQSLHGKKLSANVLATLGTDSHLFLHQLLPALPGYLLIGVCLALLLSGVLLNLGRCMAAPMRILALVSMLLGLSLSVLIYAAAGYAIEWTGLFSRVTLPISFWLSMVFAGLFVLACRGASHFRKVVVRLASLGILLPLCNSLIEQSQLWTKSWEEQQSILTALPQSVVELTNRQSLLIVDIPRGTAPVFTFSAFWDISGAIVPRMLNYVPDKKPHEFATVLRQDEWRTTWDGVIVRQYWCNAPDSPLWGIDAKQVYLWKYPDTQATAMQAPFDIGCGKSKLS